jgi:hypothetical protein
MHLEGPWLSALGKKRAKQKFRNAEEAKRHRELTTQWEKLVNDYGTNKTQKSKQELLEKNKPIAIFKGVPSNTDYVFSIKPVHRTMDNPLRTFISDL